MRKILIVIVLLSAFMIACKKEDIYSQGNYLFKDGRLTDVQSAAVSGEPVSDIDGNTYNTVIIGNQCWMSENLRTTRYADGTSISMGSIASTSTAYRYYPNNDANTVNLYGYLYNWKAVMHNSSSSYADPSGVQGICPDGWHIPSDAEWTQLTNYVSSQSQYACSGNSYDIAKALASTTAWQNDDSSEGVGNDPSSNNATGFSALPAGWFNRGGYSHLGSNAVFWSSTEINSNTVCFRELQYNISYVVSGYCDKDYGFSVRCVKD